MVLAGEQTLIVDLRGQTAVLHEIHVVAGVYGVLVLVLPELQGEQGVLSPGHVLHHLDLGLLLGQPGEPLPADTPEVDLGPGRQVDVPELSVRRRLGAADEIVSAGSEEISSLDAPE